MWTDNKPCVKKKKDAVANYDNLYPARGGHVVDVSDWGSWELDEIDAGSQLAVASCHNCGEFVGVVLANGLEDDGDESPFIPGETHWNSLNHLDG